MTVLVAISTPDADPTNTPYKVSQIAGERTATVNFTVTGIGPIGAWRLHRGGANILGGTKLRGAGAVCGLSKCGEADAFPMSVATPHTFNNSIDASELTVEGNNPINIYVYNGLVFE